MLKEEVVDLKSHEKKLSQGRKISQNPDRSREKRKIGHRDPYW